MAVFVVVVVLFSIIGCHRSLSKVCREAESAFFDKTVSGSLTCPADHLDNCIKYANRVMSVISGSDALSENYDAVSEARTALIDAMDAEDIHDIYDKNTELTEAVEELAAAVDDGAVLPESNDDYDTILADFRGAQSALGNTDYNGYIDGFISSTIRPFPTDILRLISFVSLPEKFE